MKVSLPTDKEQVLLIKKDILSVLRPFFDESTKGLEITTVEKQEEMINVIPRIVEILFSDTKGGISE